MELENILTEVTQTQKYRYCIFSIIKGYRSKPSDVFKQPRVETRKK